MIFSSLILETVDFSDPSRVRRFFLVFFMVAKLAAEYYGP